MELRELVGLAGVPLVQALVAATKKTIKIPSRYYPGVSIFWGVILNEVLAYLLKGDYQVAAVVGVITGLAASGLFQYGKAQEPKLIR